ncbi:hypothetical protein [Streptomyces scabiei]|nr:hypothetical protein [Streptomyces scabiei]MDX3518497.1 hypothetical protein [Streptomyces scabiei]
MSTPPVSPRMAEVSGAEALSLLEGSSPGRPVCTGFRLARAEA